MKNKQAIPKEEENKPNKYLNVEIGIYLTFMEGKN
jgi:hypothetical protein